MTENNTVFTITRIFDAPIDLIFRSWTDIEHLKSWSAQKGSSIRFLKSDIKRGGISHYCMTSAGGSEIWGRVLYRDIIKPERLVYIQYFSDEKGHVTRHPMSSTWPLEMLTTVTFEDIGGKTKVTLTWMPINPTEQELETFKNSREGMEKGWTGSFNQLAEHIKKVS